MSEFSYLELARFLAPEIIVALGAVIVLGIDLLVLSQQESRTRIALCATFATATCGVAAVWMFAFPFPTQASPFIFDVSPLTLAVKVGILVLAVFSLWLAHSPSLTRHIGEYFCLLLLSATGMMLLVSSRDLLTLFVSLELSTIPLYALAAFQKESSQASQSALKFFLLGGVSAALTLFGFSLLYGFSGSISLREIAAATGTKGADPLLVMGAALAVAGIGFKIAAAPFHLWAPGVYDSAPTASAAFIGSASKLAGAFVFGVLLIIGLSDTPGGPLFGGKSAWLGIMAITATFSIALGSLAAIVQSDLRRLLAFSAVAHAGYMMLGLLANGPDGLAAVFFYAVTYGIATIGAFGVAGIVAGGREGCGFSRLEGLHARNRLLAACMLVFMLSLAGIPPTGGFLAKFLVFATLLQPNPVESARVALLLIALAASAVSLYYYLRVLKSVFVRGPEASVSPLPVPSALQFLLVAAALIVVLLGLLPHLILGPFLPAGRM